MHVPAPAVGVTTMRPACQCIIPRAVEKPRLVRAAALVATTSPNPHHGGQRGRRRRIRRRDRALQCRGRGAARTGRRRARGYSCPRTPSRLGPRAPSSQPAPAVPGFSLPIGANFTCALIGSVLIGGDAAHAAASVRARLPRARPKAPVATPRAIPPQVPFSEHAGLVASHDGMRPTSPGEHAAVHLTGGVWPGGAEVVAPRSVRVDGDDCELVLLSIAVS